MKKIVAIIVVLTAALIAIVLYFSPRQTMGGDFTLMDMNGNTITQEDIYAQPAAIFFGYTYCPDICPQTMYDMQLILDNLDEKKDRMKFWFISVDPDRDSPQALKDYLTPFPFITGLTGTQEQVDKVVEQFGITVVVNNETDKENYTVDHTANIILLSRGGYYYTNTDPNDDIPFMTGLFDDLLRDDVTSTDNAKQ